MDCEQPYRLCGARSGSPQLYATPDTLSKIKFKRDIDLQ